MIEVITLDLTYLEVCQLLESGTVQEGSSIHAKLRAARGAFERTPKVYGNGLGIQLQESLVRGIADVEAGRNSKLDIETLGE